MWENDDISQWQDGKRERLFISTAVRVEHCSPRLKAGESARYSERCAKTAQPWGMVEAGV